MDAAATLPPIRKRMARKHHGGDAPDPANDPVHVKLSRLIDRKRAGRTDAEIAHAAGIDKRALSRLLTGGVPNPTLGTLRNVLSAIGSTLCEYERA
jgi:DNA-binding phage protein